MTPGQAEQSLADFQQYQATDQKAREANRQMMQQEWADDQEKRRQEASKASFYNQLMMRKEEERRQEERKERIARYHSLVREIDREYAGVKTDLDSSSSLSRDISHTEEAQAQVRHISERYDNIIAMQNNIFVNYASLINEREVNMVADRTRMYENMNHVSDKLNRAKRKVAKSVPARNRLARHAGQKEVHQMMRVIYRASEDNGDYSMIPQNENQQSSNASKSSKSSKSSKAPKKEEKRGFKAWIKKWNSKILHAADLINSIMSSHGDLKGNDKVSQSGSGIGAVLTLISTIKTIYHSVKNIATWKAEKNQEDGKSAYSRGREAISAFNQVIEILKGLLDIGNGALGVAGGWIGGLDPVSSILSIISNSLTILQQTVNLSDSKGALSGIEKRKEKIRAKMREKQIKYKDDPDLSGLFTLGPKERSDAVKKRREALRAQLAANGGTLFAGGNGVAAISAQQVDLATASQNNKFRKQATVTENGKSKQVGYTGFTQLSQALAESKGSLKGRTDRGSNEYKDEKKRVRMMEALELLNEYYAEDEARDRQRKQQRAGWLEIAKAATSMIATIMKFFKGTGADVAGYAIDMLVSIADKVQYVVKKLYARWSEKSGHNNDKKLRRNEIAESFFESIKDLTTNNEYHWNERDGFDLALMKDFRLLSASDRVSEFAGMIHGTRVDIEPIMQQTSRGKIIQMMSQAYAQDQSAD